MIRNGNCLLGLHLAVYTLALGGSGALVSANGRTFFISSSAGNDAHSALDAVSPTRPWKTIGRALKERLQSGDQLRFKRGDVFSGNIRIAGTGKLTDNLLLGAYGKGARPVISGRQSLLCKEVAATHVWECPWSGDFPTAVWVDGVPWRLSRYPAHERLTIDSVLTPARMTLRMDFAAAPSLLGSVAVVQHVPWSLTYQRVISQSKNRFELDAAPLTGNLPGLPDRLMNPGSPVFFMNLQGGILRPGEWSWNPEKRILQIGTRKAKPQVVIDAQDWGFVIDGRHNVTLQDFRLVGFRRGGISARASDHLKLLRLEIDSTGLNGIEVKKSHRALLRHLSVRHTRERGCVLHSDSSRIDSTDFEGIGLDPNYLNPALFSKVPTSRNLSMGKAVEIRGNDNYFVDNIIRNVGYDGIFFYGRRTVVARNRIIDFCQLLDDGGGVYTTRDHSQGSVVEDNVIRYHRRMPNNHWVHGVYLDDLTDSVVVRRNYVWRTDVGVMLHNCSRNSISMNEVHFPSRYGVFMQEDKECAGKMHGNALTDNVIRISESPAFPFGGSSSSSGDLGCKISGFQFLDEKGRRRKGNNVRWNGVEFEWLRWFGSICDISDK